MTTNSLALGLLALVMQAPAVNQQVKLAWEPVVDARSYNVYYHVAADPFQLAGSTAETNYTVSGLAPGSYTFAVTALNASGESAHSNEVTTILVSPGPRIDWIGLTNVMQLTIYVAWTTTEECSGLVQVGVTPDLGRSIAANNLGTIDHFAVVTGLLSRTHYFYRVVSVCNGVTIQSSIRSVNTK